MKVHELKTWPRHFEAIFEGRKHFEFRKNDRDFKVGDQLHLREWAPAFEYNLTKEGTYTGREVRACITYILTEDEDQPEFVPDGWVILSIVVVWWFDDGR